MSDTTLYILLFLYLLNVYVIFFGLIQYERVLYILLRCISQFHLEIESWETNFDDNIFISRSISVSRPVNWEHFGPRPGLRSETKTLWGYEYSEWARQVLSSYGPLFLPGPWIPDTIRRYSLHLRLALRPNNAVILKNLISLVLLSIRKCLLYF